MPPPRALTDRQSLHAYDQPLPAESPLDPDIPIPPTRPDSQRHASIPAIWQSNEGLSRGFNVRDTPRGVLNATTVSAGIPRSNSGRRKAVPRYEVYEDGPSKPPRPARREHAAQKSVEVEVEVEMGSRELIGSSDVSSSASFGTSPVDKVGRRVTDPTQAIDPEIPLRTTKESGSDREAGSAPARGSKPSPSLISPLDSPDSPASLYTHPSRSLFFSTPIQSPTSSSSSPSPRKSAYSPLRRSGLNTFVEDTEQGNRRSSAEMKSVMASLYRVTRDAGVRVDPGRLGIRDSQIAGLRDSAQSGVSRDSVYSLEVLSEPQRKYRGGVI